jgi:hypothetical protein
MTFVASTIDNTEIEMHPLMVFLLIQLNQQNKPNSIGQNESAIKQA